MKRTIKIIILSILLLTSRNLVSGQTDKEKAYDKAKQAVQLEDEGKFDDALKLLNEAQKLDPEYYLYPYEIGYAYYLQQKYDKALEEFKKVLNYNNINDQCYSMLGNTYDILGDTSNAFKSYNDGLKLFPKSGRLFLEKGNVYWGKKEYLSALEYYEQGIIADPKFPSNYFRATKIYCATTEEVWGMIYGEIFMNLERNSKRTEEISKLLYDKYKSEIVIKSKSSATVSFCQRMTINVNKITDSNKITLPFCMVYEPSLILAVAFEKEIDINSLDRIRNGFLDTYFQKGFNKTHPNILFDYQYELQKSGNFEAYNHWILMKGDEKGFNKWLKLNKDKWDNFVTWFSENKIQIDDTHKFYSGQY
jgi:tetratricopeptide (TPR) repeat protein